MTVDNSTEHLGYFHEIPDALYCYPQIRYAFSLKNVETDDWIIELLTEEMTGHKQQSVEKSVKTQ